MSCLSCSSCNAVCRAGVLSRTLGYKSQEPDSNSLSEKAASQALRTSKSGR